MKIISKKAVRYIFCFLGLTFSTSAFSQTMTLIPGPGASSSPTGICGLEFTDMQMQLGDTYLPVSSTGSITFPSEYSGLPVGNLSMTSDYCNTECAPCQDTGCPYGTSLTSCLNECSTQVFVEGAPVFTPGGTISVECAIPPSNNRVLQKKSKEVK
ncbi:MAG: hypothetical protein JSR85_03595 [Proteobacteria bacterium]|nr:hypothetical protein [Pseudomonadota bacterium]